MHMYMSVMYIDDMSIIHTSSIYISTACAAQSRSERYSWHLCCCKLYCRDEEIDVKLSSTGLFATYRCEAHADIL